MISPWMLPLLHLRRQAHAHGWRIEQATERGGLRSWRWRDTSDRYEGGVVVFEAAISFTADGDLFDVPDTLRINTPEGLIIADHLSLTTTVAVVRAYFGWPPYEQEPDRSPCRALVLVPSAGVAA